MDVSAVYREGNGDLSINNWDSYKKSARQSVRAPSAKTSIGYIGCCW